MKNSTPRSWLLACIVSLLPVWCRPGFAAEPPLVFPIREGDLHGLIDRDGKVILSAEFAQPLSLSDGLIMASPAAS